MDSVFREPYVRHAARDNNMLAQPYGSEGKQLLSRFDLSSVLNQSSVSASPKSVADRSRIP